MAAWELVGSLEEKVHPSRAALVTIDVQNDFFHDDGFLGKLGAPLEHIQGIVPQLRRLLDGTRDAGVPVVHVISYHDEEYASVVVTACVNDPAPICPVRCVCASRKRLPG